jgi:hypothetical protein
MGRLAGSRTGRGRSLGRFRKRAGIIYIPAISNLLGILLRCVVKFSPCYKTVKLSNIAFISLNKFFCLVSKPYLSCYDSS